MSPPADWLPVPDSEAEVDLLPYLHSDHGNAERLMAYRGSDLRYCSAMNKWLVWTGSCWTVDVTDLARQIFKHAMLEFLRQAVRGQVGAAEKFAKESLNTRRISNGLHEAQHGLAIVPEELDRDPWALNFANCTVDLRTGNAREHTREDYISKALQCEYRPGGSKCPLFMKFMEEVTGGGPDAGQGEIERSNHLMDYLQLALGYSVTGVTSEKAVFLVHGPKDNGKSTLLALMRRLLGKYAVVLKIDSLMQKQGVESANAQADLADLRGARYVMTSETEEGQRLAEGKLKQLTQGCGTIKAVRKYENPIEFPETHKLWIDANFLPIIKSYDDATWRRLHTIPFTVIIPKERQDRSLSDKLLSEAEGILCWVVQGAVRWHKSGLMRPPEVEQSGDNWRRNMDRSGAFMDECCNRDAGSEAGAGALYKSYKNWAEANGERAMSNRAFAERLQEAGIQKRSDNRGAYYLGVGLRMPLLDGV